MDCQRPERTTSHPSRNSVQQGGGYAKTALTALRMLEPSIIFSQLTTQRPADASISTSTSALDEAERAAK